MRSPTLVDRAGQLAALDDRIAAAHAGAGSVIWIVGDAGSGKSRLVRDALDDRDPTTVLSGRAVDSPNPVPFRPLTEAFQHAYRGVDRPDSVLGGLARHVGALVPAWSTDTEEAGAAPAIVVGEGAFRLLQVFGGRCDGCVLVLEDLHWADPETLEVVSLLTDACPDEGILVACTARPEGAAAGMIDRLARHEPESVVTLEPLDSAAVALMVAACLDAVDPPPGLAEFVSRCSDGNPFLVEELLEGLVATGDLRRVDGHWSVGELRATVPASLRASIHRRLTSVGPEAVQVLGAAALLGREFDWELLPGIAETDGQATVDALRAGMDVGLVEARPPGFRFRHALTREAVLAELLPPELQRLAARAWPVIVRAHPGLRGPALELAADLAEAAGDSDSSADLVVQSARRALDAGALATAESTARRAVRLAGDSRSWIEARRVLVEALVSTGKAAEALAVGRELSGPLDTSELEDAAIIGHHLTLAEAAVLAGELAVAAAEVDAARRHPGAESDPDLSPRVDVVAAHVALDAGDLPAAAVLAERARDGAEVADLADVVCDATLVIGRVLRPRNWSDSIELFEQAARTAEDARLPSWHLRARQELAYSAWITGDTAPLSDLRSTAVHYGALTTVAQIDLARADIALSTFATDECRRAATDCIVASRRYHLAAEPVASLWLAGAHALAGDEDKMRASIDAALAPDPDDPRILGDLYGRVLLTRAIVRDELDAVADLLENMAHHTRRAPPGTSVFPGRVPRALLHAASDDDRAGESRGELALLAGSGGMPFFDLALELVDAVAAGRRGNADDASGRFAPAYEQLAESPLAAGPLHSLALFFSPAAHRDGWGEPASWLRVAEAWFATRGHDRVARRCRIMLGEIGAPVPRRGRGASAVPEGLRAQGVTSREVDVLLLVAAGRTNREIAEELVVSPKTVERHLSNLFVRTGATNRHELVSLTDPHLADDRSKADQARTDRH